MKKSRILLFLGTSLLIAACAIAFAACGKSGGPEATPTPTIDPFDDPSITYDAYQWVAGELKFTSDKEYGKPVYETDMDCIFTNTTTGTTYTVPAFWNGGTDWIVRYALTEKGDWTWETKCTDTENAGLNGQSGTLKCGAYRGDLDIYKHGFVTTQPDTHYFVYADGTPFFYLGDTHWTLPMEEIDGIGKIDQALADQYGVKSQFKYIMDYRADQGFTVIQSQQLATYNGASGNSWMGDASRTIFQSGVNDKMLAKFQQLDIYFQYIADKGFVHSHTQFAYPEELIEIRTRINEENLEKLCRYWVARYSAYPVLWATTQEGDNDYFEYNGCKPETNPWVKVFDYIQKYDPYDHPATCHQEHVSHTRVENSLFNTRDGYSFYAMQYSADTREGQDQTFDWLKEFYNNDGSKPVVNYEGHYEYHWAGPIALRTQGWCAYLNGVFGFGYGVQPIWSIFWASNEMNEATYYDETYRRDQNWIEGLTSSGGFSMSYMKKFFSDYEWWNLVPCFDGNEYYQPNGHDYSVATVGNDLYIGYFYTTSEGPVLGTLKNMKGKYEVKWFNPITGEFAEDKTETINVTGDYQIPGKPTTDDWAMVVKYIGE